MEWETYSVTEAAEVITVDYVCFVRQDGIHGGQLYLLTGMLVTWVNLALMNGSRYYLSSFQPPRITT